MIGYKVTKNGVYETELFDISANSVYYMFKERGSEEMKPRREMKVTSRHIWVLDKDEANALFTKIQHR